MFTMIEKIAILDETYKAGARIKAAIVDSAQVAAINKE